MKSIARSLGKVDIADGTYKGYWSVSTCSVYNFLTALDKEFKASATFTTNIIRNSKMSVLVKVVNKMAFLYNDENENTHTA